MVKENTSRRLEVEIRSLDNMLKRRIQKRVKESGLDEMSVMHGWVLVYLYKNPEKNVYQKDLEKKFGIRGSSVTTILQMMEKKGYIRRESVDYDNRLKKLVLLEKGRSFYHTLDDLMNSITESTMMGVTEEEKEIVFNVLDKIKNNLKEAAEEQL